MIPRCPKVWLWVWLCGPTTDLWPVWGKSNSSWDRLQQPQGFKRVSAGSKKWINCWEKVGKHLVGESIKIYLNSLVFYFVVFLASVPQLRSCWIKVEPNRHIILMYFKWRKKTVFICLLSMLFIFTVYIRTRSFLYLVVYSQGHCRWSLHAGGCVVHHIMKTLFSFGKK